MIINDKTLHIPPYVSTSWKHIIALHLDKKTLVILLDQGNEIRIPDLPEEALKLVFAAHAKFLEMKNSPRPMSFSLPINMENLSSAMEHNPNQANFPPFPKDVLNKIVAVSQTLGIDKEQFPLPEENCNCPICQIAKVMHGEKEEKVSSEELAFRTWDIRQAGEKLYSVTNPLDEKEHYTVFLGEPIGCTCGEKNCEHVLAVLKS